MYSPTTRLLTVLALLQSRRRISGPELARRLEIAPRTVRRYIAVLQDMGIPVEAERGPYGAYWLGRGYKLPPLIFTDEEAVALVLGLLAIREYRFPVEAAAVEGALAKTERVMPERLLDQVRALQEAISFYVSPPPDQPHSDVITALSTAIQQRHTVHLDYRSWAGKETEREFDPYGIVLNEGYWYTAGYCHLRRDLRTFRLDRIGALEPTDRPFERPEDFDVLGHVLTSVAMMPGTNQVEVVLETTMERARQVLPPIMGTLEPSEDGVIFRRAAYQLEWIAHVLIAADFPVRVRQPDELRDRFRQIAARALRLAGDGAE